MFKLNNKTIESLYFNSKTISKAFINNKLVFNKNKNIITKPYYCEVEYIESTGTQWIDTGIYLTNNHSVEIDFQLTSIPQYKTGIFGGLINSGDDSKRGRYGRITKASTASNAGYFEDGYGKTNIYAVDRNPNLERYLFKQEKNKVYVNGTLTNTFNETTFSMGETAPLGLFKYTNYTPALAKYYASKWWDGDELIRDFIPVLDLKNTPCMYDRVTKQFFYNKGTGQFLYSKV